MREMDTSYSGFDTYLRDLGVPNLPRATCAFDPGYDPVTVESHLEQSAHLLAALKLSMSCWLIADEHATRAKVTAARRMGVPVVTGGSPFEVAAAQKRLVTYLDLCADLGVARIEAGAGFTDLAVSPPTVMALALERGLEVQYEVGWKGGGTFTPETIAELIGQGRDWLDAGAAQIVVEARESARGIGLFSDDGSLDHWGADRFADRLGLERVVFEAPTKTSQFSLLQHFGASVRLGNVRLEEVLRVEIYRRGLHSDAFANPLLRPRDAHSDSGSLEATARP